MSSRKRQRAIISQDEPDFRSQADEADSDLVGMEQAIIGGDRSTAGIRIKGSKMPPRPGIYKGKTDLKNTVLSRIANSIAPVVDVTLIEPDFGIKQAAGGYQMVFDAEQYFVRTTTGTTNLGLDTLTALDNKVMHTATISMFRNIYRKIGTDVNAYTVSAVESTDVDQKQSPSLFISGFTNTKTFNNLGTNTIVLELWDMICKNDTDMSPVQCWSKDLYAGNYGSAMPGASITPSTTVASRRSWADPGVRPNKRTDKVLFESWDTLRITRYLIRSGQTIHHVTTLPSTEISQMKLYPYNNSGGAVETHDYLPHLSVQTMGFAIGELAFDETSSSQKIACSSVFLEGRGKWEFKARTLPRTRQRYNLMTNLAFESATSRMDYYPSIPTVDQKLLPQTGGIPIDVIDQDAANLDA